MAIQSPPDIDAFINNAATSQKGQKPSAKPEKKKAISLRMDPKLLEAIDQTAGRRGMTRVAFMSYWSSKGVEAED